MLKTLHRDITGKANVVHIVLVLLFIAGSYALIMYYPPYVQFMKIRSAAKQLALTSTTTSMNDDKNKSWYDSELKGMGAKYPMSRDLLFHRYNEEKVEVGFEYDYSVEHPLAGPHVLHFSYRCIATAGICDEG